MRPRGGAPVGMSMGVLSADVVPVWCREPACKHDAWGATAGDGAGTQQVVHMQDRVVGDVGSEETEPWDQA